MNNWVLGEPGSTFKQKPEDVILSLIGTMDSETIHKLVTQIWLMYDDAVLRETGHLYNLGEGDPHWEGHL
jgi:hypothetical protein